MSQVIVEQQFHYTMKMTSNKHFPNAIYANYDATLENFLNCRGLAKLASLAKYLWWLYFSLIWPLLFILENNFFTLVFVKGTISISSIGCKTLLQSSFTSTDLQMLTDFFDGITAKKTAISVNRPSESIQYKFNFFKDR